MNTRLQRWGDGFWLLLEALFLAAPIPFLCIFTFELLFDSRGGEPFSGVFVFFITFPIWVGLSIVMTWVYCRKTGIRRVLRTITGVLFVLVVALTLIIRAVNSRARSGLDAPVHACGKAKALHCIEYIAQGSKCAHSA
jgi:hypothetical protein